MLKGTWQSHKISKGWDEKILVTNIIPIHKKGYKFHYELTLEIMPIINYNEGKYYIARG